MFDRKAYMKIYKQKYYKLKRQSLINYSLKWQRANHLSRVWTHMKARCNNPENDSYSNYGKRGIKVLYKSFKDFKKDIGNWPGKGYSIDRINNGHYKRGNCKWATAKEQANNWRTNVRLQHP